MDKPSSVLSQAVETVRGWVQRLTDTAISPAGASSSSSNCAILRALIDGIPHVLFVKDCESRFVVANHAAARAVGQIAAHALIGKSDIDFHEKIAAQEYRRQEQGVMFEGLSFVDVEELCSNLTDGDRWVSVTKLPLQNAAGEVIGLVGCCHDITDRKRIERLHQREAEILKRIAGTDDLSDVLDTLLRLVEAESPGIQASVQLLDEEYEHIDGCVSPSLDRACRRIVQGLSVGEGRCSCGTAVHRKQAVIVTDIELDPLWRDYREAIRPSGLRACWSWPIVGSEGAILGTVAMYSAKTGAPTEVEVRLATFASHVAGIAIRRKQSEDRIRFLAQNDALTGLPNRFRLGPIIEHALRNAAQIKAELAVVLIDIDNFKNVNDDLGHHAGDEVLKVIAERLLSTLGPREAAARLGADEFVVLLRDAGVESGATLARVGALRAVIGAPIAVDDKTFHLTTSIGVAHYPRDGAVAETIIASADSALFRAKEFGRDNVQMFSNEMIVGQKGRLFKQEEIRRALQDQEFLLYYQPQISLRTGRLIGVEALVRWQHPSLGLLSPAEFVPLAEQTGLIVKLGDWVLCTACRQNKAWQLAGLTPVTVSVNVSARQFRERNWINCVAAALNESKLEPCWLELELTESLIMQDLRKAVMTMQELRALGLQIAIDDFGTGYSNLSNLKTFPVNRLKIDRSFVHGLPESQGDVAITGAVIALGHQLGLDVIAEGAETENQLNILRDMGCDNVQGYVTGRAMPAAALEEMLERPTGSSTRSPP